MARDYQPLFMGVIEANRVQAVQTLAEIVTDKDGKTFISRLGSEDAELCIEILDDVSPDLYLLVHNLSRSVRASPQSTISDPPRNRLSSSR